MLPLVYRILTVLVAGLIAISSSAQPAVISEYYNSSKPGSIKPGNEYAELLVLEDLVDLSGYMLYDNSASGTWQPAYIFNNSCFNNLQEGTVITIYFAADCDELDDDKSDGHLRLPADNPGYFIYEGTNRNASLNIAADADVIVLADDSGTPVHAMGHTPASGLVYEEFLKLTCPKVCHTSSIENNRAVVCSPGGEKQDYASGYGGNIVAIPATTPGIPNTPENLLFVSSLREPDWPVTKQMYTRIYSYNNIELRWQRASVNPDRDNGFTIILCEGDTWDPAAVPTDGRIYASGEQIGSGRVAANIPALSAHSKVLTEVMPIDTNFQYRVYAYRYGADFLDSLTDPTYTWPIEYARGRSYNISDYAESGILKIQSPTKPSIMTESGELEFCEGDTIGIIIRHSENYQDCSFRWFKDDTEISGATSNTLQVTESGRYTLEVTDDMQLSSSSNALNIQFHFTPKINIVRSSTGEVFSRDTALYLCRGEDTRFKAEITGDFDRTEWYRGTSYISDADGAEIEIDRTGEYFFIAFNEDCPGFSPKININLIDIDLRFSEDTLYFDADDSPVQTLRITNGASADLLLTADAFDLPTSYTLLTPPPYLIPGKSYLDIEIEFKTTATGKYSDSLLIDAPCNRRFTIYLEGKKRNLSLRPHFSASEIDWGNVPFCSAPDSLITLTIEGDESCVIETLKEVPQGWSISTYPELPHDLSIQDLEISIFFLDTEIKQYKDTLRLDWQIYGEKADYPLLLPLSGKKTEPELDIRAEYMNFDFSVVGCETEIDTFIVVENKSVYDIVIDKNFSADYIRFVDSELPRVIKTGKIDTIPIVLTTGNHPATFFTFNPCNQKSIDIKVNIKNFTPELSFDAPNDTLSFGRINSCLSNNRETILAELRNTGVPGKIKQILFDGEDFDFSGIAVGDSIFEKSEFEVTFFSSPEGLFVDSVVFIVEPCELSRTLYLKAERFRPEPPYVSDHNLDFGEVVIDGYTNTIGIIIENLSNYTFSITGFKGLEMPFKLLEGEVPYKLVGGASRSYTFSYQPESPGKDSVEIVIEYDSPCEFSDTLFLKGSAVFDRYFGSVRCSFPPETGMTINRYAPLPLSISLAGQTEFEKCKFTRFTGKIIYNPAVIYFRDISPGPALLPAVQDFSHTEPTLGSIVLDITLDSETPLDEGIFVESLILPLLSDTLICEVFLSDARFYSDSSDITIISDTSIVKVSGKCDIENKHIYLSEKEIITDMIHDSQKNILKLTIFSKNDSHITGRIYNSLGETIEVFINQEISKGKSMRSIHIDRLPSGIYFLTVESNHGINTFKFLKF